MKKALYSTFTILIFFVLTGKVLNWFLNFSDEINQIFNTIMFTLIGITYIVMGFVWDDRLKKIVIVTCGIFLIVMNFYNNNSLVLDIIGILCILIPMLIARFYKEEDGQVDVPKVGQPL